MKIALVHEMLIKLGGAEKILQNWIELFPQADVFTLMYDEKKVEKVFPKNKIHPQVFRSSTQKIYNLTKKQRLCLPFMANSIESFDFSEYDIILISSSGFAHGIISKPETKTIIYYHAPARYMWDWTNEYKKDIGAERGVKGYILGRLFLKLRQWDYIASKRHDITLVNSRTTQKRIEKYFRLNSEILYPPIETERFAKKLSENINNYGNYYIILSALTEFKRLDVALKNFPKNSDTKLLVIGDGEQRKTLEQFAGKNIVFLGAQFGDSLVSLVQNSLGLIFPGEEDFGIVPIEVMAAGKPIFALRKGGLTETVLEGITGEFFEETEGGDFIEAFEKFHTQNIQGKYTPENCKKQAEKFDKKLFEKRILELTKQ